MIMHDNYQQFATVLEAMPDGAASLHVFGDVDLATADLLEEVIDEVMRSGVTPAINFTKCRYLDSSGLSVLVRIRKRFGKQLTVVVRPSTAVYRVLHMVGFDKIFDIVAVLPRSVDSYRPAPVPASRFRAGASRFRAGTYAQLSAAAVSSTSTADCSRLD